MTPEIQSKVVNILDTLSAKLGVASEHLWGVMVKQAYVGGISNILSVILVVVNIFIFMKFVKFATKEELLEDYFVVFFGCFVWGIITIVLVVSGFFGIFEAITQLVNPEYWVLREILAQFK